MGLGVRVPSVLVEWEGEAGQMGEQVGEGEGGRNGVKPGLVRMQEGSPL